MIADTPIRRIRLGPTDVTIRCESNGCIYVRSKQELGPYPLKMTERIDYWASHAPDRTVLAQRGPDGDWRKLAFAEVRHLARNIGQALLDRGLSSERPVCVLSANDIEHALLAFGAMYAGIPYAPISPAYSLLSSDFGKLRHIFNLVSPGLVFASSGSQYEKAIAAVVPEKTEVVTATSFADLLRTPAGRTLDDANARIDGGTIVKILFTSGSTGIPKGVINTQRMWCSNQEMIRTHLAFLADEPPILLDWTPWHHTFGGNHDIGVVLYNGGTLYIDEGKPVPGLFEKSLRNLREIATTFYLNVPKGFEALVPHLRADAEFRKHFFSKLKLMWYAGAGLSQPVWDALAELSVETCGERVLMLTGLGSTETAPFAFAPGEDVTRAGHVGVPGAGIELKLVPAGEKLEARLRGPNITPGYWRQDDLTREAFDEEGFYKFGDALQFVDENKPSKGFVFNGRLSEDFKLSSGTWVSVGPLRARFLSHCAPYAQDVVIAGEERPYVGVLIFPNKDACPADPRPLFKKLLEDFAKTSTGGSNRIAAAIILEDPPSIDAHEVTDKGSLNQRAILQNRRALVEELYNPYLRTIQL
jgi:feruloyl-CoA synthase